MEKFHYIKVKESVGYSLQIGLAEDILDAIKIFESYSYNSKKLKNIVAITSELSELILNQKIYTCEEPLISSFEQMGKLLLSHLPSEFNHDKVVYSKRLTSINYKRHIAALTLYRDGKYYSTFTYTYSIISEAEQIIELRYLLQNQATFITCYAKTSKAFIITLKCFINNNTTKEESLNKEYAGGNKRHSDYFDYEFITNTQL